MAIEIESQSKFKATTDSRIPAGQEKIQTGSDHGETKRLSDVRALEKVRIVEVVPVLDTGVANIISFDYIVSGRIDDFFDEIGSSVMIEKIVYHMKENSGKQLLLMLYNEDPRIEVAPNNLSPGDPFTISFDDQKKMIDKLNFTAGTLIHSGSLNSRTSFVYTNLGMELASGATKNLWFAIQSQDTFDQYVAADSMVFQLTVLKK